MSTQKHFKNKTVYIPELLEALNDSGLNQRQKRIDMIREYAAIDQSHYDTLRAFVECVFHPAVVFDLPDGDVPYKPNPSPDYGMSGRSLTNFFREKMPLYLVKGAPRYVQNQLRRETLFIQQLETIHAKEAVCVLMMRDKQLTGCAKFVNYGLFKEAFPEWLPDLPN